jgi:shikimate dehydrogenase
VISATTRLAGVIGDPVRHSLSPALHNAAFTSLGLDWVYLAFPVAAGNAAGALAAMRTLGIDGLSVTMPHKRAIAELVDDLDPAAAALGTVNTVVRHAFGRLTGHSTDGAGFVASLRAAGVVPEAASIVVIGAGGAALAVTDALARSGAGQITVINRSHSNAQRTALCAGDRGRVGSATDIAKADIVINATSVGMGSVGMGSTTDLPCDVNLLHAGQVVADLVYHPLETPLLSAARAIGATCVDGLGMLVHQAALQQQLWTGHLPDVQVMRAAAECELAARQR